MIFIVLVIYLSTCYALYLFFLFDYVSNYVILGVTGKNINASIPSPEEEEEEETPQLMEWTPDDVF